MSMVRGGRGTRLRTCRQANRNAQSDPRQVLRPATRQDNWVNLEAFSASASDLNAADFRFWHLTDIDSDVEHDGCFEGKNGHGAVATSFPLMTQSGRSSLLQPTEGAKRRVRRKMFIRDNDGNEQRDSEKCPHRAPHPSPEGNRQKDEERT